MCCGYSISPLILIRENIFILLLFINTHQYIYFHRRKIRITWHLNQFQQKKKNCRRIILKNVPKILSKMWKNSVKNIRNIIFFFLFYHVYMKFGFFFWHFAEVYAIYNAHTCSRSISKINLNHDTTSLVKLTTWINPSLTLIPDSFNMRLFLIW